MEKIKKMIKNAMAWATESDFRLFAVVCEHGKHIRIVAVEKASAFGAGAAGLVFGRTKQRAGQHPGKGTFAKAARACEQIRMHHVPAAKLVHCNAAARAQMFVIHERGQRRALLSLCQC